MGSVFLGALALAIPSITAAQTSWPEFGQNAANTADNSSESAISPSTVSKLQMKWKLTTHGDVSARAAVANGIVYFPDWGGYLWAVNAETGKAVWSKRLGSYVTDPATGKAFTLPVVARATPAVANGVLYIGLQSSAYFLAINASNGSLVWKTRLDTNDSEAKVTSSASVANGVVYVGVASKQEGQPGGGAKTARGAVVALRASSGKTIWKAYMVPSGYTGAPVWSSSPVVDASRGTVFVSTGDNYAAPTDPAYLGCVKKGGTANECQSSQNYADSVVALSLSTGKVKWARRMEQWPENSDQSGSDFFNLACNHGEAGCPDPEGPDYDFASSPNEIQTGSGTILGVGQKSGLYFAFNPSNGDLLWQTQVGPGAHLGGIMWGSAADSQRIYVAISDANNLAYAGGNAGSWAALNPANGKVIWRTKDPYGAMGIGPVAVANGVVFVPSTADKSTDRNMIALDAATGKSLWSFASGASTIAGASIVNGMVFWGTGYTHLPLPGFSGGVNAFYGFSLDGE